MPINAVIRNKRKELELTQEQIADYLGVSTPAVNKWEKGASYPDISLLPPLARILKIDLNTLLCFEESLSTKEILQFSNEIATCIEKNGYESGFQMANEKIKEYPNCAELIENLGLLLEGMLLFYGKELEKKEFYEEQILALYERAAKGDNEKSRNKALYMLASKYIQKKEYEKAQELLDLMPEHSALDKKILQASLFRQQEKLTESAEILDRKLLNGINEIQSIILSLLDVELALGNDKKAEKLSNGLTELARQFELWDYSLYVAPLQIAMKKKNVQESLDILKSLLETITHPWDLQDTTLYNHIFSSNEKDGNEKLELDKKLQLGDKMRSVEKQQAVEKPSKEKLYSTDKQDAKKRKANYFYSKLLSTTLTHLENSPDAEFLRSNDEFVGLMKEYWKKCDAE